MKGDVTMTNKEYKRLTTYNVDFDHPAMTATRGEDTTETIARHIERLYELENAIKNGTLVFLPCKPGDTVWFVNKYRIMKQIESYTVDAIRIKSDKIMLEVHITECPNKCGMIPGYAFGQDVFTNKEAAEKALEELEK